MGVPHEADKELLTKCKQKWKVHTDKVIAMTQAAKRKAVRLEAERKKDIQEHEELILKRQKVIEARIAGEAQIEGGGTPIFSLSPDIWRMLYGMLSDDVRDIVALSRTCKISYKYYKSLGGKERRREQG